MLLKLNDLNIIRKKTVKIRYILDNQGFELLCQNSIIHKGSRALLRHCVTAVIALKCVPKIVSSNPNFSGTHRL